MRVLVCGGRYFSDYESLRRYLDDFFYKRELIHANCTMIVGGAPGADSLAERWVRDHSYAMKIEVYKADWKKYGRAAGVIRNIQMLEEGKPDLVIVFPGGRGTANMVELARKAGVPVEIVPQS